MLIVMHIDKLLNSFAEENQIYSHILVHNINNFVTEGISISEGKISFKEINSNILNAYHDKLAKPKNMQSLSLSASNHHYLKELPITGFIVDYDIILDFINNRKLNEQCIACSVLPLCGGYLKNAQVECPSFKNIPLSIFSKVKQEVRHIDKGM